MRRADPSWPASRSIWRRYARTLGQDLHDHTAVLRTAVAAVVRRDRLVLAVADHVHLVQRHLVLLVEIPLHGLGALEAQLLVQIRGTRVVRVAFDLDED